MYWAAWDDDVDYFQPNTATSQTYTAAPLDVDNITYTTVDSAPTLELSAANVDRTVTAYLEQNDALRGRPVTIVKVFKTLLGNSSANITETYYVDGANTTLNSAAITLVPRTTIYNITTPRRVYNRNQCPWQFKSLECTGTSGTPANATLASPSRTGCMKTLATCASDVANASRYGGFPGIPKQRTIFI